MRTLRFYQSQAMFDFECTYRASGDSICLCGQEYSKRPIAHEPHNLSFTGEGFLHRLCTGALVKL